MFCITALQWKTTIHIAAILLSFKLNFVGILNISSTLKSPQLSVSMILKHTENSTIYYFKYNRIWKFTTYTCPWLDWYKY